MTTFGSLLIVGLLPNVAIAGGPHPVTFQVRPVIVREATDCGVFGFDFELLSTHGDVVGKAHACANDVIDPGGSGKVWRPVFSGTMYLELPGGTALGSVVWDRQLWIPDAANPEIIERFHAIFTKGTDAYANMTGTMSGGGRVQWDGDAPVAQTLWTITLRQN